MKLIALVSNADEVESTELGIRALTGLGFKVESIKRPIQDLVEEVFQNKKFPFLVSEHHVRHFFSKMRLGTKSISQYSGKKLKSTEEMNSYFESIAKKAYGENAFAKHFFDNFKEEKNTVVTDVTKEDIEYLRDKYRTDFTSVAFTSEPSDVDVTIPPQKSASSTKRVVIQKLNGRI